MGKQSTVTRQLYRVYRRSGNTARICVLPFVLTGLLALSPANARAQPPAAADAGTVPPHVHVAALLKKPVHDLLERSETFRAQMATLSRTHALGVAIVFEASSVGPPAEAVVRRYDTGAIVAIIYIRSVHNQEELLAHEVEHLIEQIERVPIARLAQQQRDVWRVGNSYESARAIAAGRRVRREVATAGSTAPMTAVSQWRSRESQPR